MTSKKKKEILLLCDLMNFGVCVIPMLLGRRNFVLFFF